MAISEEVILRRREELAALQAYYDDDFLPSSFLVTPSPLSSPLSAAQNNDSTLETGAIINIQGPWFIRLGNPQSNLGGGHNSMIPALEIRLPSSYPFGSECPTPVLHNVMMKPQRKQQLLQELQEMYEVEMDVGILWGERCREEMSSLLEAEMEEDKIDDHILTSNDNATAERATVNGHVDQEVQTFIPPTTRYNQPIRHFPKSVIDNPTYQREIIHTPTFHPPKSGASENMIAHVCHVTCIEHVQWALASLLFNDKKVAKATHNMFAYRFYANRDGKLTLVKDNDDDGEKGAGAKLASLLELCRAENVLVVVSRWYGGQLLGPARFKWIADVARKGLAQGGFILEGD